MSHQYPFSLDHRQNPVNPDGTDAWRITPETAEKAINRDARYQREKLEDLPANVKMFLPQFNSWGPDEALQRAYDYFQGQLVHVKEGEIDVEADISTGSYSVRFPGWKTDRVVTTFEALINTLTYGLTEAWIEFSDKLEKEEKAAQKSKGRKVLSKDISEVGFLRLTGRI